MLRRTVLRLGAGGDKASFAAKRRVIHPIFQNPMLTSGMLNAAFTTDPMKESRKIKFHSAAQAMKEVLDAPERLEGGRSRAAIDRTSDVDFDRLVEFISGANADGLITGRRFKAAYEQLTESDDVFVWLCMVAMAVLNPGDMQSRLIYRHLEALVQAVASGEMQPRTAFRFYESAVRSPAFRAIAQRQTEAGATTRLAGICAAADALRRLGVCKRPMTSYFELYQRITERSEANTPWGFPPLLQFEHRLGLESRLGFFARQDALELTKRRTRKVHIAKHRTRSGPRIFWMPPTWKSSKRWAGPWYNPNGGIMPD